MRPVMPPRGQGAGARKAAAAPPVTTGKAPPCAAVACDASKPDVPGIEARDVAPALLGRKADIRPHAIRQIADRVQPPPALQGDMEEGLCRAPEAEGAADFFDRRERAFYN